MRLLMVAAAGTLFFTPGAQAKDQPADPSQKRVCKRIYEADTGSHFRSSKRVCRKAAEWKELEDDTARAMQGLRERGSLSETAPAVGGGG